MSKHRDGQPRRSIIILVAAAAAASVLVLPTAAAAGGQDWDLRPQALTWHGNGLAGGNQCPNLDLSAATAGGSSSLVPPASSSANDRVKVNELTGERTFNARIVGIFSCLDSDSASNDLTLDFRLAKPVIDLAIKAANRKYSPQMQFNVTYRTAPDICRHQQAAGHAADEYYVNGANYFVGPGCSESLASVGQLASYWNVPICSTGYLPEVVTARFNPLTLMQLSLSVESVGEMLLELFQMYKWRHLVIVTDEKHPLHSAIRDGLQEFFHTLYMRPGGTGPAAPIGGAPPNTSGGGAGNSAPAAQAANLLQPAATSRHRFVAPDGGRLEMASASAGAGEPGMTGAAAAAAAAHKRRLTSEPYHINITSLNFAYSKGKPPDYDQVMLDAAAYSRIMLLLARSSTIGDLLSAAHQQGMSRGQFVFIAHELFETQMFEQQPQQQQQQSQSHRGQSAGNSGSSSSINPSSATNSGAGPTTAEQQQQQQHANYALSDKIEIQPARLGNATNSEQLTREIFQPLMTISLRIPTTPEFDKFRTEVAGLSEREFNYRIQPSSLKAAYSLGVAAFIYDCVMLYADKVHFVLNQTQFSKIDGQTIFELAAGRSSAGALTGDLTINRAGQRVIDFTLNDFSPKSLALEPIAHFVAIERRLNFLPGKQPHWASRNQSVPKSDPRCRINDTLFCRYSELDSLDGEPPGAAGYPHSSSDRFVLGVWLLIIIILSVALTSSIIGYLVYRRFRIESELLNLWWSIKYEDILFEDEPDVMGDGKRSMSSLAISNESFNDNPVAAAAAGLHATSAAAAAAAAAAVAAGHRAAGPSPHQSPSSAGSRRHELPAGQQSAAGTPMQLGVDGATGLAAGPAGGGGAAGLSAGGSHSGSQLSVTGGGSAANIATPSHHHQTSSVTAGLARSAGQPGGSGGCGGGAAVAAAAKAKAAAASGASKLIPLLNKSQQSSSSGGGGIGRGIGPSGSGKFSGSSAQLGGAKSRTAGGGGAGAAQTGQGSNFKDPSISSQNKNVKLRLGTVLNGGRDQMHVTKVGMYKASRVAAKHLNVKNLNINRQLLIELRQVRDLTHENLIKFIGLCPEEPNVAIVSELCTRGNLQDLLQNETIRLDWPFRYSIMNDIVDGLIHLHSSPIAYHGRLKSSNCVIDNRFVVKLTDFGLPTLLAAVEELDENVNPRLLLWTAPEHLRTKRPLLSGSQKGDIYSLAIIFQEIITRCGPFECEPILCGASQVGAPLDWQPPVQAPLIRALDAGGQPLPTSAGQPGGSRSAGGRGRGRGQPTFAAAAAQQQQQPPQPLFQPIVVQHKQRLEPEEIVNLVRMGLSPPFRPYFRPDVATAGGSSGTGAAASSGTGDFNVGELIGIVQNCWQEAPAQRPSVQNVKQQIKKMRRGCHLDGANLMDNLLQRMERYTDNLESLVEQKTAELMEEKKRSEELLYEMLPRFVVDQLKYGHSVTPEAYEAVTISFSDIKDFTSIAAQSSPIEVVNLLNQLYTEFDDCIAQYDVYKVETIGDAYMVVSGLPIRNGDQHAKEIAEMSLALLDLIGNFEVAHLPHVQLELRIGIHSGPCASGVVGTRMFRYCLFGDTVNTASRMESHGEPMKIHTSEDSANILQRFGCFVMEPRGQVDIKGKGIMSTYWLTGKIDHEHEHDHYDGDHEEGTTAPAAGPIVRRN